MKEINMDIVCKSCDGTGLYVGMAEHDGAAVVCSTCKGTGCQKFTFQYEDFVSRRFKVGVKRVFQANPGISIGESPPHQIRLEDFGGMPISDWLNDKVFEPGMENRKYTCPAWWYQSADYKNKPDWEECSSALGVSFSRCKHFPNKNRCWQRWDKEFIEF